MKHSRSSLFLMEMILAILFFSLASAVCIQLFAKSHTLSKLTINQNHALIQTQNLAEGFLAAEGDLEEISSLFPLSDLDEKSNSITLYFDDDWNPVETESAAFQAVLTESSLVQDGLISADISVTEYKQDKTLLYSLQVKQHIPERSESHE